MSRMGRTIGEIGAKMDALGIWEAVSPFNWAVKPLGTAFPYFCSAVLEEGGPVKVRFMILEGWQTLHDYVRSRVDDSFGYCSSPVEMPHFEMLVLRSGAVELFRYDPGYAPQTASDAARGLVSKVLWEAYGVMLRLETDRKLPLRFADEKAVFARVETAPGRWEDRPLEIPDPRPIVEKVEFPAADVKRAQDLPFDTGMSLEVDFRLLRGKATLEARPKSVYALAVVDGASARTLFLLRTSVVPECGLKGMWETMPARLLKCLVSLGKIPGEIKLVSARVFRLLRPLCLELPVKLSIHDSLPVLEAAFSAGVEAMTAENKDAATEENA